MRIGHVHLKVRNLKRSEDFYMNLLGAFRTEHMEGAYSFLTFGKSHHEIALQEVGLQALMPRPEMVGLYHTAFEVNTRDELLHIIDRLEQYGIYFRLIDHRISWAVYTSDPDGNGVEVYLDRRSSTAGAQHWRGLSRQITKRDIELDCQ